MDYLDICVKLMDEYCTKVERKIAIEDKKMVARLVLEKQNLDEWSKAQEEDFGIALILQTKREGVRPSRSELMSRDISAQLYWLYWDTLVFQNGILYKEWEAPNLKSSFLQLIVPRKRVKEILEEIHDSPSGGHFGINKTLEKVCKRFY